MHKVQMQPVLFWQPDHCSHTELCRILEKSYTILMADGKEEVESLLAQEAEVAALVVDERYVREMSAETHFFNKTCGSVPVFITTDGDDEQFLQQALRQGAVACLKRPYDSVAIVAYLQNLQSLMYAKTDFDTLTGIPTRKRFLREVEYLLNEHPEAEYVIGCMNIRHFKLINEMYRSATGDRVLHQTAKMLQENCKAGACGRLEADKFAFCLPRHGFHPDRLQAYLMQGCHKIGLHHPMAISMGLHEIGAPRLSADILCDRALLALSTAEESGVSGCAYFSAELHQKELQAQRLLLEVEAALREGQFQIYLQPIYSLSTEQPTGAEALVRWLHPTMGLVSPGVFIPLLEQNGLILKLDLYVWERVFQCLAELKARGIDDFPISANMSQQDLYHPGLYEDIAALARKYDVPPHLFHIEITESSYMDNPGEFLAIVNRFRAGGFSVVMDDFGSGYSSLNMLMDIPVDILKLDMNFVRSIATSERSKTIVDSVVRMAKWLEMGVVAEGVETEEQLTYLRSIGCDKVQGYYYSKPLSLSAFNGLVANFETDQFSRDKAGENTVDVYKLWDTLLQTNAELRGVVGAVGIFEWFGDLFEITYVNDEYYHLTRSTPSEVSVTLKNAFSWIRAEDRQMFRDALYQARAEKAVKQILVRRMVPNRNELLLLLRISYLGDKGGRYLYAIAAADTTGQLSVEGRGAGGELFAQVQEQSEPKPALLIADDNQVNRAMLKRILSADYAVYEAENGLEAWETLTAHPDVRAILLDLVMPVMSGYDFLRQKQAHPALAQIPTLVLSISDDKVAQNNVTALGGNAFLRKPYDVAAIRTILGELLSAAQPESEPEEPAIQH